MRTAKQAVAAAAAQVKNPTRDWYMDCLLFFRLCWDHPPIGAPAAKDAWAMAEDRRGTKTVPLLGAPVYWAVGKFGHISPSAGDGTVYSNDIRRKGRIDRVPIAEITRKWNARYLGWSGDYGGNPLPLGKAIPPKPKPGPGFEPFPGQDWFRKAPTSPVIEAMAKRLAAVGCGEGLKVNAVWETTKGKAYQCWQKKLGYTGRDADGWPGPTSWAKLQVPNV